LFKSPFSRDLCINRNDWQNPIFAQLVISLKLALAGLRLGFFKNLTKWLKPIKEDKVFCMEATGIYGVMLAKYLHQLDQRVIVANPIKTNAF
jgi:transposase